MNIFKRPVLAAFLILFCTLTPLIGQNLLPDVQGQYIVHEHYSLDYWEEHEQARWVAYVLDIEELTRAAERTDDFRPDPSIESGSADLDDYYRSGYDRGHLAPAADMAFSLLAMSESFLLSNISPQKAEFNRGVWRELEALVRQIVREKGSLFIVTGPVLNRREMGRIGPNEVTVPPYFYKVLLSPRGGAIALLLPHEETDTPLGEYALSVDELEEFCGIDFFSRLPQEVQAALEGNISRSEWEMFFPGRWEF